MGDSDDPEQNESPNVSTSQMCKTGNTTKVIWHLKGWNEHSGFLKDNAGCIVEVATNSPSDGAAAEQGDEQEEEKPEEESTPPEPPEPPTPPLPSKFRFFLGEFERQVSENKWKRWFSLWVSLLNSSEQKQVALLVEVEEMEEEQEGAETDGEEEEKAQDEEEDDDDDDIEFKAQITLPVDKEGVETSALVKQQFIPMCWWKTDGSGCKIVETEHLSEWAESEELKFKISVTLFNYTGTDIENDGDEAEDQDNEGEQVDQEEEEEQVPLIRDLKAMYAREENYADVTLETRDGTIINAHKFVLAARSTYFRGIIEREVKKKGFTGLIKLGNVDGKPMSVVLHWMYTDEILEEQLGKVMDEVIKVSVKWELKDLLKMLDKKLISVCNTRNMLHLFQVAHKNGLYTAIADISDYIKQNIDSVIPLRRAEDSQ